MSNTKESVTSLLVIIAFLALTAIAAVLYGGSQDQQSQLQNNWLWQKARWALDTAWSAVPGIINSPDQSQNAVAGPTASGGCARVARTCAGRCESEGHVRPSS